MPDTAIEEEPEPDRRRLLALIGSGAGAIVTGTGVVGGQPGKGRDKGRKGNDEGHGNGNGSDEHEDGVGPCTCDGCPEGTFCGKIEGQPEAGKSYTFSSDGDSYSVTIDSVETKEGNAVTGFSFSSDDDVGKVCVKGGPETATYTENIDEQEPLSAPENPGGQQPAIGNVSFCGDSDTTHYRIVLAGGDPIQQFDDSDDRTYSDQDRLLESFSVSSGGETTSDRDAAGTEQITFDSGEECTFSWDELAFDASDATSSVDVTLTAGGGSNDQCTVTLAGYRLPEDDTESTPENVDDQEFLAADTTTLTLDEPASLSIDL